MILVRYVCMHACIDACMHACMYVRMYVCKMKQLKDLHLTRTHSIVRELIL